MSRCRSRSTSKLLDLMEIASRECIDVKVVPDLLQFIALRARLEDLDGLPVININDVPLQGINARGSSAASTSRCLADDRPRDPVRHHRALINVTSPGPVFYPQERMGLDGQAVHRLQVPIDAARRRRRQRARSGRAKTTRAHADRRWLRRFDLDELPQFWNVLKGDMSIVGPRPERPFFVEQFKHRIPQYMLRHKVKAGITGWAQVNGWRGNTSLEKRIEYDLYYIENWSVTLDLKIMWLTLVRGLFQRAHMPENRRHRRRRLHRLPSLRNAPRPRPFGRRHRQPADRRHAQHRPPARPRLRVHPARRHALHRRRRAGGLRAALGEPGQPDRLPRAADPDAEGRVARHAQRARPGQGQEGAVRARLDVRGLRRSARASAEGDVLGQRQSDRPARRLRRGQAVRRGDDARLPPVHGVDTKIVRIFNTYGPRMRLRDGRAVPAFMSQALRTRTSPSSATARRPAASATSPTWWTASSADGFEDQRAGEHRQPARGHDRGDRADDHPADRIDQQDRLPAAAG